MHNKANRPASQATNLVDVEEKEIENDRAIRDTIPCVWKSAKEPLFHVLATCEGRPPTMNKGF